VQSLIEDRTESSTKNRKLPADDFPADDHYDFPADDHYDVNVILLAVSHY
jgi:hypothetical protein